MTRINVWWEDQSVSGPPNYAIEMIDGQWVTADRGTWRLLQKA